MKKQIIKIGIIGAGSIGSLFGAYLAKMGYFRNQLMNAEISVVLFSRKGHAIQIKKNGLILKEQEKVHKIKNIRAFTNPKDFLESETKIEEDSNTKRISFDFLFLTTKTYDIKSAINEYQDLINRSNWLVVLQNGIGNEEIIKNMMPQVKMIRMVTTNGALLEKPGFVTHTGDGTTKMGISSFTESNPKDLKDLKNLKTLLETAGLKSIIVEDIVKECWGKIFVNIGINAFGALTQLNNGDLLKLKGLKNLMKKAIEEAQYIARKKNIEVKERDFITLTYDVARKTANNKNSMLQDIQKGNRTEIDFINGKIVSYAEELGVEVPVNKTLTYLIKGVEFSNQKKISELKD